MEKPETNGWVSVKVRKVDIEEMQRYSELSHAPISALVTEGIKLWIETRLPGLMTPFEKKD